MNCVVWLHKLHTAVTWAGVKWRGGSSDNKYNQPLTGQVEYDLSDLCRCRGEEDIHWCPSPIPQEPTPKGGLADLSMWV